MTAWRHAGSLALALFGPLGPDLAGRLTAAEEACLRRPEFRQPRARPRLRLERRTDELGVVLDLQVAETVGPLLEAIAAANGLAIRFADLGAVLPSTDLESPPSRVWAAIGRAALEHGLALQRGEPVSPEPFRYVRVEEVKGRREAHPDLPALHPTGAAPVDQGPTKYDDWDWHVGGTFPADQPSSQGFVHIGIYLTWLIMRGFVARGSFDRATVEAVKSRGILGSDLRDDVDGKLVSDMLTDEGAAFSDAYYGGQDPLYLRDWNEVFGAAADAYAVPDTWETYDAMAARIDRRYEAWLAEGRPRRAVAARPASSNLGLASLASAEFAGVSHEDVAAVLAEIDLRPSPESMPHVAPELERLLPQDLTEPPLGVSSVRGTDWGSSRLSRSLKRLGLRPREATVVTGLGGSGPRTLAITLYRLPGVAADRLMAEFAFAIYLPPGAKWVPREIAGQAVNWAEGREFAVAFWARDELVVHVAGKAEDVAKAVPRLP